VKYGLAAAKIMERVMLVGSSWACYGAPHDWHWWI